MGTHPIFESDFDCLTDSVINVDMGESGSESRSDSQSDFGVKISIQALKGHPFVILEGNDAKKKYVPAPKQSDFDQSELSESDEENIENRVGPNQYMPRSASGTLDREWEYQKQKPVASSSIPPSTFNPTRLSDLNRMNIASSKTSINSNQPSINASKYRKPVMADGPNVFEAEQKNAK